MSLVPLVCFLAVSLFSANAATLKDEVVVGADARQMMRNVNHQKNATPASPAKTITINLYYETKCPDCIEFINGTLEPLWRNKDIRPHLNITMNPYGNAMSIPLKSVSEGYKFWHPDSTKDGFEYVHICQHGTDECLGNLIQACAISMVEKEKYMELVFCMAQKPDWSIEKASYECMDKFDIDHDHVKACVGSPQGNKMFADLGNQTGSVPGRQGTPWVMINGANLGNTTDLLRGVCTAIGDSGPKSCDPFKTAPAASDKPAQEGGDGDFTVLVKKKVQKKEKALVALSPNHI